MIGSLKTPYLITQVPQVVYGAKGVKHQIRAIRRGDKEYRKKKRMKKRKEKYFDNGFFNFISSTIKKTLAKRGPNYNHKHQKTVIYKDITLSHHKKMKSSIQKRLPSNKIDDDK